jgi:hypothetical protein
VRLTGSVRLCKVKGAVGVVHRSLAFDPVERRIRGPTTCTEAGLIVGRSAEPSRTRPTNGRVWIRRPSVSSFTLYERCGRSRHAQLASDIDLRTRSRRSNHPGGYHRGSRACSSVDRASASGAEGRRFESCRARHERLFYSTLVSDARGLGLPPGGRSVVARIHCSSTRPGFQIVATSSQRGNGSSMRTPTTAYVAGARDGQDLGAGRRWTPAIFPVYGRAVETGL